MPFLYMDIARRRLSQALPVALLLGGAVAVPVWAQTATHPSRPIELVMPWQAGGGADSSLLKQFYPQMQARAFEPPRSYARQLLKDLKAVTAYAHELQLSLPMLEAATRRYTDYVEQGHGMADTASIVNSYRPSPESAA